MKKLRKLSAALALCLVVAMLSMSALAEPVGLVSIAITDPVVSANGQTMMDMTGLEVDLVAGGTQSGDTATFQVNVLGGGETALAATAEIADGQLVLAADGLNDKYTISADALADMLGSDALASFQLGQTLGTAFTNLMNGTLPQELNAVAEKYGEEILNNMTDEGVTTYTMLSGEMEMQHISIAIPAELMDGYMNDFMTVLDSNSDVREILNILAQASGQSEIAGLSLADQYAQLGMSQKIEGDIYTTEDGSCFAADIAQYVTDASNGVENKIAYSLKSEMTAEGLRFYADSDIYNGDEPMTGLYFAMQSVNGITNVELGTGEYDEGEFEAQVKVTAVEQPAVINGNNGYELQMTIDSGSDIVLLTCTGYVAADGFYGDCTIEAEGATFTGSFTGSLAEQGLTGQLALSTESNGESYGFTANIAVTGMAVESSEILVGADGAVAIDQLSEDDMTAVSGSAMALVVNAVSVLDRNVPGLSGLMSMLMGGMNQ